LCQKKNTSKSHNDPYRAGYVAGLRDAIVWGEDRAVNQYARVKAIHDEGKKRREALDVNQ
jgi:hypothetical protein